MANGYCKELSWCPNIDSDHTEAIAYEMKGLEGINLKIYSGIHF
jgi:hypothetical protein